MFSSRPKRAALFLSQSRRYDEWVNRQTFLLLLGAAPLIGAATGDVDIPVELRGGRFFAVPQALDGNVFSCWLDTSGDGFILDSAIEKFGLPFRRDNGKRRAVLPPFRAGHNIPPVRAERGELAVFERSDQDKRDPILRGLDAQLGTTWFSDRVWRLDYPGKAVRMRAVGLDSNAASIELTMSQDGVPQVLAVVGDDPVTMEFDIAASVAYAPQWTAGGPEVQATSFVPRATLERWRRLHPSWKVSREVSSTAGCDRIVVPQVRIGAYETGAVAFTTRPGDDVFAGGTAGGKLGANAYADCVVTIDYPNRRLRLDRQAK